jgi:hypothetical protein
MLGAVRGGYTTTPKSLNFSFDTFPLIMRRAPQCRALHASCMDGLTDTELLANAVGFMALGVLDSLAGDKKSTRAFLEGFLHLVKTHGLAPGVDACPASNGGLANRLLSRHPIASLATHVGIGTEGCPSPGIAEHPHAIEREWWSLLSDICEVLRGGELDS